LKQMCKDGENDLIGKVELKHAHNFRISPEVSESSQLSQRVYLPFTTRRLKMSGPLETNKAESRRDSPHHHHHHQLLLMRGLHYTLCDLASSIDRMYGLQILLDFTLCFTTLTTSIYFCIQFITRQNIHSDVTESEGVTRAFSISVVWMSLVTIRLVAITASCNAASTEANYATHILQRILLEPDLHPNTMRQAQLFLQQVTNRPLHFTAWGFFTINYTALGTIMCSVATYLFILLQF
jgi:hypothetical protein